MGRTIEERMLYLYQSKYAKEFNHLSEVKELREKQEKEKEDLKKELAEKKNKSVQYSDDRKYRSGLFCAGCGICAGMCVTSAFFLGLTWVVIFFIGFVIFAMNFKSAEKDIKEEDFNRRFFFVEDDKRMQELERRHNKEYRLLIVKIAIEKGYIHFSC